jgi:hypothetical protein
MDLRVWSRDHLIHPGEERGRQGEAERSPLISRRLFVVLGEREFI